MIDLIEDIIVSLNTKNESLRLVGIKERIDTIGFNVILINIIKWLKLEHKRVNIWKTQSKPLRLDYECDWCRVIKQLVEEDIYFKSAFSITADELYYNDSIEEEIRQEVRRLAFEGYNPKGIC